MTTLTFFLCEFFFFFKDHILIYFLRLYTIIYLHGNEESDRKQMETGIKPGILQSCVVTIWLPGHSMGYHLRANYLYLLLSSTSTHINHHQ